MQRIVCRVSHKYEICMCTKVSELCKLEIVTVDLGTSKEGLISDVTADLWTSKERLISGTTADFWSCKS